MVVIHTHRLKKTIGFEPTAAQKAHDLSTELQSHFNNEYCAG